MSMNVMGLVTVNSTTIAWGVKDSDKQVAWEITQEKRTRERMNRFWENGNIKRPERSIKSKVIYNGNTSIREQGRIIVRMKAIRI